MTFIKNVLKNLCHKNKRPGIAAQLLNILANWHRQPDDHNYLILLARNELAPLVITANK